MKQDSPSLDFRINSADKKDTRVKKVDSSPLLWRNMSEAWGVSKSNKHTILDK